MKTDRIFGLCVIGVALAYIAGATQIQVGFLSDPVGSRTFPYIVGAVALVCALAIVLKPDDEPGWPPLATFGRIAIALVVLYGFAVTLRPFGFLIPAAVASAAISYLISPRPVAAALCGVGLSVVLFAIFRFALGLSLAPFGRLLTG